MSRELDQMVGNRAPEAVRESSRAECLGGVQASADGNSGALEHAKELRDFLEHLYGHFHDEWEGTGRLTTEGTVSAEAKALRDETYAHLCVLREASQERGNLHNAGDATAVSVANQDDRQRSESKDLSSNPQPIEGLVERLRDFADGRGPPAPSLEGHKAVARQAAQTLRAQADEIERLRGEREVHANLVADWMKIALEGDADRDTLTSRITELEEGLREIADYRPKPEDCDPSIPDDPYIQMARGCKAIAASLLRSPG